MASKTALLVAGFIVGAAIGWFTAPTPAVDIHAGGVDITVPGDGSGGSLSVGSPDDGVQVQVGRPGGFLPDPLSRALVFGVIGAAAGFGVGYLGDRRKV